jgi:hypothetical protein
MAGSMERLCYVICSCVEAESVTRNEAVRRIGFLAKYIFAENAVCGGVFSCCTVILFVQIFGLFSYEWAVINLACLNVCVSRFVMDNYVVIRNVDWHEFDP